MRPRVELAVALAILLVLGIVVTIAGARRARVSDVDRRRSTFLSGPSGARAFTDALERLGVQVERHRRRLDRLDPPGEGDATLIAVLGPSNALDVLDGEALLAYAEAGGDLLLAGPAADAAIACFGWRVMARPDRVRVTEPGREPRATAPDVRATLAPHAAPVIADSSDVEDGRVARCTVPAVGRTDTLLVTAGGGPVAVRLALERGGTVTLVSDDRLFANRSLRDTDAGPFALGLVAGRYERLVVDEFHHGFGPGGSLAGAAWRWSLRSPLAWMAWQLAAVGLVALLAAGVRFGPALSVVERRRRSPLEHVRALATALAAARGHDVAVALMVRGLRRRLGGPPGRVGSPPPRSDTRAWLAALPNRMRTPRGREAAEALVLLTSRTQPDGVLRAAHAVEDVWEELRP